MAELTAQLLTHVLDRVRSDLTLLESVGCIAEEDLERILAKLPTSVIAGEPVATPTTQAPQPLVSPNGPVRRAPPPPTPPVRRTDTVESPMAEAKWDYDSDASTDPADLTFKQGDKIEIIEETSPDWWKGRLNGREGLFPSNRCVKVEAVAGNSLTPTTGPHRFLSTHRTSNTFSNIGVNKIGLTPASVDSQKKDKYENLKSSGIRGLGFGTGAAIGGGLVRAIF